MFLLKLLDVAQNKIIKYFKVNKSDLITYITYDKFLDYILKTYKSE